MWRGLRSYFPARLVKTADLPADGGSYLLCLHPHGVLSRRGRGAAASLHLHALRPLLFSLHASQRPVLQEAPLAAATVARRP